MIHLFTLEDLMIYLFTLEDLMIYLFTFHLEVQRNLPRGLLENFMIYLFTFHLTLYLRFCLRGRRTG